MEMIFFGIVESLLWIFSKISNTDSIGVPIEIVYKNSDSGPVYGQNGSSYLLGGGFYIPFSGISKNTYSGPRKMLYHLAKVLHSQGMYLLVS